MGYLKVHCAYCGGTWEVYGAGDWQEDRHRKCPHCFNKVDGQDWHNHILPAFGSMMDANRELIKTHTGYHTPLFTVDYIEDYYFPDAAREAETAVNNLETRIEELQGSIEEMGEMMDTMANAVVIAATLVTSLKEGEETEA